MAQHTLKCINVLMQGACM